MIQFMGKKGMVVNIKRDNNNIIIVIVEKDVLRLDLVIKKIVQMLIVLVNIVVLVQQHNNLIKIIKFQQKIQGILDNLTLLNNKFLVIVNQILLELVINQKILIIQIIYRVLLNN